MCVSDGGGKKCRRIFVCLFLCVLSCLCVHFYSSCFFTPLAIKTGELNSKLLIFCVCMYVHLYGSLFEKCVRQNLLLKCMQNVKHNNKTLDKEKLESYSGMHCCKAFTPRVVQWMLSSSFSCFSVLFASHCQCKPFT